MNIVVIAKGLEGDAIYPDISESNLAEIAVNNWPEYESFKLTNGVIVQEPKKECRTIKCDLQGGNDYYDGYIKGYLHNDNKFTGSFDPVLHSGHPIENMDGKYLESKDGLTIFGKYYINNEQSGNFILNFGKMQFKLSGLITTNSESLNKPRSTNNIFFSKELFATITNRAQRIKDKYQLQEYDQYSHIRRLNLKPTDSNSIILATGLAYSWMPTMLHLHIGNKYSMKEVLEAVIFIGKINSYISFIKYNNEIIEALMVLTECINHSIVGVSKTLHIFYPENVPMIDSNVLIGWDLIFRKHYKKHPELRLNKVVPVKVPNQVILYMSYWEYLLEWSESVKVKSVRMIEEPFYWIGKSAH